MEQRFGVDLGGIVDLLSRHLYSSPRVYLRELLQNAVDAVTARRAIDPAAPATITLSVDDGALHVTDTGIGLTAAQVDEFLATIGRSSKRDELEFARREFLGQFGIGLLSAFVVADEIVVESWSAADPSAPAIRWVGRADGTYTVVKVPVAGDRAPGTRVTLRARSGMEEWVSPNRVESLGASFAKLLPYEVRFENGARSVPLSDTPAPWARPYATATDRADALAAHCNDTFGFTPLAAIDLDVPVAGLKGVAYVLSQATGPAVRQTHRTYLKGMLLGADVADLAPEWAFFVRCVVDADELRPTASREAVYDDGLLAEAREAIGQQVWAWVSGLPATDPAMLARFVGLHHLGVRARVCTDPELLADVIGWLPFETTEGVLALTEVLRRHDVVRYTERPEQFRQLAGVAAAQGICVVNGGYAFDSEILALVPQVVPGAKVEVLDVGSVSAELDGVDAGDEMRAQAFLAAARTAVTRFRCDVELRAFDPVSVPVLRLDDREAAHQRASESAREEADGVWGDILGALEDTSKRACLVLNHRNPLISRVVRIGDEELATAVAESLYVQAALASFQPISPADAAAMNRSLLTLVDRATP